MYLNDQCCIWANCITLHGEWSKGFKTSRHCCESAQQRPPRASLGSQLHIHPLVTPTEARAASSTYFSFQEEKETKKAWESFSFLAFGLLTSNSYILQNCNSFNPSYLSQSHCLLSLSRLVLSHTEPALLLVHWKTDVVASQYVTYWYIGRWAQW